MRRGLLLAVLLFLLGRPHVISADHNGPWLPGRIAQWPAQWRALNRGYLTYCFDNGAEAYPDFRRQAHQVADYAAQRTGIGAVEVSWGSDCDVRNTMPADAIFLAACGNPQAAACIQYWTPQVTVYYRRALAYSDWRSALCHEGAANTGHLMGLHEEYDDRNFRSNGRWWTCMDFGPPYTWELPDFDRDYILASWLPDMPAGVSLVMPGNGWAYVTWTQERADGGYANAHSEAENYQATIAVFGWAPYDGAPIVWAGDLCGPDYGYCFTDFEAGWRGFDPGWRGCLYVAARNPITWFVPSYSGFWAKAGCW